MLTGHYFESTDLLRRGSPITSSMSLATPPPEAKLRPEVLRAVDRVVREARLEYGSVPYREYHFLVTRSRYDGGCGGLEHAYPVCFSAGDSLLETITKPRSE